MAGAQNGVIFANNVDFTGGRPIQGRVTQDAQLLIGNADFPNIRVGNLISSDGSVIIDYSAPNIDLKANIPEVLSGFVEIYWKATDLDAVEENFAELFQDSQSNADLLVRSFSDSTENFVNFSFTTPEDLDITESITFRAYIYAANAEAENIQLRFGHTNLSNGDDWNVSFTNLDSGDFILSATQNEITIAEWSETVNSLGWSANQIVNARLSRIEPLGTNLTGNLFLIGFSIQMRATASGGGGNGNGDGILTITGNAGGGISADGAGNINFVGKRHKAFYSIKAYLHRIE
jgi:hypothetical protein